MSGSSAESSSAAKEPNLKTTSTSNNLNKLLYLLCLCVLFRHKVAAVASEVAAELSTDIQ